LKSGQKRILAPSAGQQFLQKGEIRLTTQDDELCRYAVLNGKRKNLPRNHQKIVVSS
jgi:hypothetical protein